MSQPPAFQWYPKDCDTDERVRLMSHAEFGFYVRCLNHAWINDGLPELISSIAKLIGGSVRENTRLWEAVQPCFEKKNDRWYNRRQEQQRAERKQFVESRRNAAEVRWGKQTESKQDARALQVECSASASSTASSTALKGICASDDALAFVLEPSANGNGHGKAKPIREEEPADFAAFWKIRWSSKARKAAVKAFRKKATSPGKVQVIMAAVALQKAEMLARPLDKRPYMSTWLNDDRFLDEAEPEQLANQVGTSSSSFESKQERDARAAQEQFDRGMAERRERENGKNVH